jgi:hypothetical protein
MSQFPGLKLPEQADYLCKRWAILQAGKTFVIISPIYNSDSVGSVGVEQHDPSFIIKS